MCSWLSHFPTLCYRHVVTAGVLSGHDAIFVSSYRYYVIIIIILGVFGAAMDLPNGQSKRYPLSTPGSATNSEEISIMLKEVVFRGVTLCSCVRCFRSFGGAEAFHF
jgi:hypothetical protein